MYMRKLCVGLLACFAMKCFFNFRSYFRHDRICNTFNVMGSESIKRRLKCFILR